MKSLVIVVSVGFISNLGRASNAEDTEAKFKAPAATKKADAKPNFDNVGPQVGDQLPELNLHNAKGELQRLSDAWRGGPALLVTSSFTCPKSRSRWPELNAIAHKYGDKLNVVVVYVVEAHPVGSICPYKGVEDVTPENQRDGILRRQPKTLSQRVELAQEFKRYLRVDTPIYVDNRKNQAWKTFGAAPNIAFLVDTQGFVMARQGWFDGPPMEEKIDSALDSLDKTSASMRRTRRMTRDQENTNRALLEEASLKEYELKSMIRDDDSTKLADVLKRFPRLAHYRFPIEQGHAIETTLLMEAVKDRNFYIATLLIQTGADLNARTSSFDSTLQLASRGGDLQIVRLLLQSGAKPDIPLTGNTPLHEAALSGHLEIASVLIDSGAKPDFVSDVALGNADAVRKSLASDASLALRPDGAGRMPMDYAAANGRVEIAKLLLARGAPVVDDPLTPMEPPLHRAIRRKDIRMVKLLLDAGSSPSTAVGRRGESAESLPSLHLAVSFGEIAILKLLLEKGADLAARDTHSQTALHNAASQGKAEITKLLIEAGADVNSLQLKFSLPCGSGEEHTPSNNTPLHFAAARGNPETITVLLKHDANIEVRNRYGLTPLMSTIEPPLYTGIAEESQLKNVETLLDAGADINAVNNSGQTILDIAMASTSDTGSPFAGRQQGDLRELITLLKNRGAKQSAALAKK